MKYQNETLYQLCTKASEFDGEWAWQGAGMSYLIRTKDNNIIAIDGGHAEDAEHMIEKMREVTGEEKPHVLVWIITHPHTDHYCALLEIAKNRTLRSSVQIDRLCYHMPPAYIPAEEKSFEMVLAPISELTETLGVPVVTPHTGDVWELDGVKIRFFFTPEDFDRFRDGNELSLIFRVQATNKSIMFTGDTYPRISARVALKFWGELESDICQLAHHGLNGADASFYARVNAKTVLIPTSISGDRAMLAITAGIVPRLFAERLADRVIKAYEGDIALDI